MHILLTDILTCPRCGPDFGLIVLADRIDNRQVSEGQLGCANCRSTFPIEKGTADLRLDSVDRLPLEHGHPAPEVDRGFRAAALLGPPAANASILTIEIEGFHASEISRTFPEAHVIGVTAGRPPAEDGSESLLSRIRSGRSLPFRNQAFRGVAVFGTPSAELLAEVVRVLARGTRVVIDSAPRETVEAVQELGLGLLLDQDRVVVAVSQGRG